MPKVHDNAQVEDLPLSKAAEYLLEECRMILPGIQALFGFQLVVVFNNSFTEKLGPTQQRLHLVAISLIVVAIALVMAPAAYHRQTSPTKITATFISLSTRLVLLSMVPLSLGICLDLYLIVQIILPGVFGPILAIVVFVVFLTLWFILPRVKALQRILTAL